MKKVVCAAAVLSAIATPLFADQQWPVTGDPVFKIEEINQHVSVFSNKDAATQGTDSVFSVFNKGVERIKVRPGGITEWILNSNTGEAGKFVVSTPGGGVGVAMFVQNPDGVSQTRFDIGTWPTDIGSVHVSDVPISYFGFNNGANQTDFGMSITQPKNYVGINSWAPTQRLEVKEGGIRINNASSLVRPACDSTTRGTFWVTTGNTDSVSVCLFKGNGNPQYKWRTIVSTGDDEHETTLDGTVKHKDSN